MGPSKNRRVAAECRLFKEEWILKYFFTRVGNKAVCLLCQETVTVFKEYNLKRHHEVKHESKHESKMS